MLIKRYRDKAHFFLYRISPGNESLVIEDYHARIFTGPTRKISLINSGLPADTIRCHFRNTKFIFRPRSLAPADQRNIGAQQRYVDITSGIVIDFERFSETFTTVCGKSNFETAFIVSSGKPG